MNNRKYNGQGFISSHPRWLEACRMIHKKYWLWMEHKRLRAMQGKLARLRKELAL